MAIHVAILLRPYIRLILEGRKTIESRLTITPRAPYRQIAAGERIYFKASAGPFMAAAAAASVKFYDNLTPARIQKIRERYNDRIHGQDEYWQWKQNSRYATLIRLRDVEPCTRGPAMAPSGGLAWFVLDDACAPGASSSGSKTHRAPAPARTAIQLPVTPGGLRNCYVRAGAPLTGDFQLLLPDGRAVDTSVTDKGMIRWRGWRSYFQHHALNPGDAVELIPAGPSRFRVVFVRQAASS